MRQENQEKRRAQIEQAAHELFEEKGYAGTSMLSVAKRAKASNETIYRWYGDKRGLFMSLIERNLIDVLAVLEPRSKQANDPLETLEAFGAKLLELLVDTRAVTLNRAAAADPSGELGKVLAKGGRDTVLPMIEAIFADIIAQNQITSMSKSEAAELYVGLLVGDLQIRRVIGVMAPLKPAEITARTKRASQLIMKIMT